MVLMERVEGHLFSKELSQSLQCIARKQVVDAIRGKVYFTSCPTLILFFSRFTFRRFKRQHSKALFD